ncbi:MULTISPECIES: DUF317 domain-containing protein [unclassified Kitasatospora]|uniref:DUF317 domain-containing protein n=1 Tax=unclassified Kitasatospora TaxID=2633591 RepID=UPI0011EA69A7|nr:MULTISPECIES: DUF317 domain-containing protein [unclassified Kitasatospora]
MLERSARALRAAGGWAIHHRVGGDAGEALRLTAEIVASGREAADHAVGRLDTDRSPRSAAARTRTTPVTPTAEMASVYRCTAPAGQMFVGESRAWQISGGKLGPGEVEGWTIEMSENIPAPLLEAVTAAMADPAPVARLGRDLTSEHLLYLDVRPLAPKAASGPSARALAARTRVVLSPPAPAAGHSAIATTPPDQFRQPTR